MLTFKKGDTAVLLGFTGIRLSNVEITAATKTNVQVTKKDGTIMTFDRKTGKQTDARDAKYANKLVSEEDAPAPKAKKEAPKKKSPKKVEPVEEEVEDEEVEEEAPKKPAKKKTTSKKKPAPAPVEEEEDIEDDEDYEEV